MPDRFMTVFEVAAILKLNQQTVRDSIDSGFLPAVRIDRRVRIKRSDFDRLVGQGYSTEPGDPNRPGRRCCKGESQRHRHATRRLTA
jgi:excisionase family DNA binding protein